jgi:hypothetical protein
MLPVMKTRSTVAMINDGTGGEAMEGYGIYSFS